MQSFVSELLKKTSAADTLLSPQWQQREKILFFFMFVHAATLGATCAFKLKIVYKLIQKSSRQDRPSISTWNKPMANPLRVGQGQCM